MKNKFTTVSIHVIAWTLLLLVPYLSTFQVIKSIVLDIHEITFLPIFVLSFVLIGIFYVNYFVLIPRYLLTKRYLIYAATFLSCIVTAIGFSWLIFHLFGLNPSTIDENHPILLKISPIARANAFLMLLISFVASISLALNNKLKQTEQEKLSAQISTLKAQINPHFLFNTLNNIYATAISTSPQAADMVERLSEMMRYTMKEIQNDFVPLEEEINYINNYIELQKIRLDSKVKLVYNIPGNYYDLQIAPMLLIPFIENAFKHGVNAEQDSCIKINIEVNNEELDLLVVNNKVSTQNDTTERSGLGIENTKYRLQLIYPAKHLLAIKETEAKFNVSLYINLQ